MILVANDWVGPDGRPTAYYDLKTTNKSFLRMAVHLHQMGINNHLFHLSLYDKDLAGIDVHTLKNPSLELCAKIAIECKRNPWYFIREVVRIPAAGGDPIPFELHRGNLAMIWCHLANIHFYGVMPRQLGKTICAIVITAYVMYIRGRNMKIGMFTKDRKLLHENVARLKEIRDSLPKFLLNMSKDDMDNKEGLSYEALDNNYLTFVAQSDKNAARNVGRGMTIPMLHPDEFAYIENIKLSFPVIIAATTTARDKAAANGMPHANIYTTTAGRLDSEEGKFAYDILMKAWPFSEKIYDCESIEAAKALVRTNSTNETVNGTFSHYQLGKDDEWLTRTVNSLGAEVDDVERDFLNVWRAGTDNSLFTKEMISRIQAGRRPADFVEIIQDYAVNWYIPESIVKSNSFRNRPIIIGSDTSDAVGRDFTTLVGVDPKTMAVVFSFRCCESNLAKLAVMIANLLLRYPRAIYVPEMKSSARGIVDTICLFLRRHGINPFTRIFSRLVQDIHTEQYKDVNLSSGIAEQNNAYRTLFGFMTTGRTREFLFKNVLLRSINLNVERLFDTTLISELCGLAVRNGRVDHEDGKHDDTVIAYLLACWFIFEARNIQHYGLSTTDLISSLEATNNNKHSHAYLVRQIQLRRHLDKLVKQHASATNDNLKFHFKQQIDMTVKQIDNAVILEPATFESMRHDLNRIGNVYMDGQTANNNSVKQFESHEIADMIMTS